MSEAALDLDRLLRLRLVVARFGEMDLVEMNLARWWNTRGQLGRFGAAALRRGFPRTHHFAQARSVFAVAAHRCAEVLERPNDVTLWHLPEDTEEEFDARWEHWLDTAGEWSDFFLKLEAVKGDDLVATMRGFDLVTARQVDGLKALKRASGARGVALPGVFSGTNDEITLLALGFARGEPGALVVPYAQRKAA